MLLISLKVQKFLGFVEYALAHRWNLRGGGVFLYSCRQLLLCEFRVCHVMFHSEVCLVNFSSTTNHANSLKTKFHSNLISCLCVNC